MDTPSRSVSSKSVRAPSVVSSASSQSVSSESTSAPVRVFQGHKDWVGCACFYPKENKLVTGSGDGALHIWDRKTGAAEVLNGHTDTVQAVDVSRDGKMIVSGSSDKTVRIWNAESGETMHVFKGHESDVLSVRFSPDSTRVVSGSEDKTMRVWSVETGELAFDPIECRDWAWCVHYSPDGDMVASGGDSVQIWDAGMGTGVLSIKDSAVLSLAWTPDSTYVIGGGFRKVTIWDSHNGQPLRTWKAHNRWIRQLFPSPNGTHLATGDWHDKTALVFDISTGEQVAAFKHSTSVNGIAYSPSEKFIATTCDDGKLYLWEAPVFEDPQNKPKSLVPPFLSLLDRPAIPAGPSRNHGREFDEFWDTLPIRDRWQAPSQPQDTFKKVKGKFTGLFTRRPARVVQNSAVGKRVEPVEVAAGRDKVFWIILLPIVWTPVKKMIYMIFFCRQPDEEDEDEEAAVEEPATDADSSQASPDNPTVDTQPESFEMSATGPSAALAAIPRTPKALACMPQQPILPTDPPSLAIAQFPSSAHPSSKSAITVTPLPMSSNSSHPTSLQPLHHGLSLPSATTLSPEEVAMVQEHRRRQTTSALVEHPAHDHESYVYRQPSTSLPKSLRSATPSTSSCPISSPPQARSTLYAGSIPALNVAPVSLLSPATARPQSFDLPASVDDTPVEAPPLSGAQPAARQPTTTEGGDWAFYEGMHQVESSIHLYA